jgi:hypothetical protein
MISAEPSTEDNNLHISPMHSEVQSNQDSTTVSQATHKNSLLPQPLTPLPDGGTIKITCNREYARVIINNMDLGTTPFCRSGFYPGFYNIELKHDDYRPFSKMVQLEHFDTASIDVKLEPVSHINQPVTAPVPTQSQPPVSSGPDNVTPEPSIQAIHNEQSSLPAKKGTIDISSNIANATIIINKITLGKAPIIKTGFLPGYYEIEISLDGYKPFHKVVQIKGNDTAVVRADLVTVLSRLLITSTPANASVIINDVKAGSTPFDSIQIKPNTYKLRVELPGYVPFHKTVLLTPTVTDSLTINLITVAFRDSVRKVNAKRNKIARRVLFSTLTASSVFGVISFNKKVEDHLFDERDAWNRYQEHDLSGYEYTERFNTYKTAASKTEQDIRYRTTFTILSLIGAAGLTISIPF